MNRFFLIIILACLFFIFAQIAIKHNSDKTNEQTTYVVLNKYDGFEIRSYPEMFVAKTVLPTSGYDGNSGDGFRKIAGFIFGGNDKNQKIAMTSPVIMDMKDSVEMAFIMPPNINQGNVPNPSNKSVQLENRPARIVAVLTFSGWANSKKITEKEQELLQLLEDHQISYTGNVTYMGYNPPYQVVDRRNEIAISVEF